MRARELPSSPENESPGLPRGIRAQLVYMKQQLTEQTILLEKEQAQHRADMEVWQKKLSEQEMAESTCRQLTGENENLRKMLTESNAQVRSLEEKDRVCFRGAIREHFFSSCAGAKGASQASTHTGQERGRVVNTATAAARKLVAHTPRFIRAHFCTFLCVCVCFFVRGEIKIIDVVVRTDLCSFRIAYAKY